MVRVITNAVLLAFFVVIGFAANPTIPVLLDTDIGDDIDDALALAVALQSPELRVLGVSTVLQQGERRAGLVWKILKLYGRTDVPVGIGAEQTLMGPPSTANVRQADALTAQDLMPADQRRNGVELIIDTCLRSPEKVTLLAYGPLTNIALALKAEQRLREHIERIVLMNGVFFRPGLEYNTKRDPEASAIVYSSNIPVLAVGLDVTMQCRLDAEQMARLRDSKLGTVQFLWRLIRLWNNGNDEQRPILHDPLAVLATVRPDLISPVAGTVEVETRGEPERSYGLTVFRKRANGPVQVAAEVRSQAAIDLFLERVLLPPRK